MFFKARKLVSGNGDVFNIVRGEIYDVYGGRWRLLSCCRGNWGKGLKRCQGKHSHLAESLC